MNSPKRAGRTATALVAFGVACLPIAACASDDPATDSGASSDTTTVVAEDQPADTSTATNAATTVADEPTTLPVDTEPASSEPVPPATDDRPLTDDGLAFISDVDPATAESAIAFCRSFGELDEPGGVDRLMTLVSDDIVIDDVVTGETYRGGVDVRAMPPDCTTTSVSTSRCARRPTPSRVAAGLPGTTSCMPATPG